MRLAKSSKGVFLVTWESPGAFRQESGVRLFSTCRSVANVGLPTTSYCPSNLPIPTFSELLYMRYKSFFFFCIHTPIWYNFSMVFEIVFAVAILLFILMSLVLEHHWRSHAAGTRMMWFVRFFYYGGSLCFLLLMILVVGNTI